MVNSFAHYELTNHLSNVQTVFTFNLTDANQPTIESLMNYYPFGIKKVDRSYRSNKY